LEKEFNERKQGLGKEVAGKELIQKQKDIDDHIREHEKDVEKLNTEIESRERSLERSESSIERLQQGIEKEKEKLREKRRELGGLSLVASLFTPKKKVKEEKTKKNLPKKLDKRKAGNKKVFDFFHGLGIAKTEQEKRAIESEKRKARELKELERKKEEQRKSEALEKEEAKRKEEDKQEKETKHKETELDKGLKEIVEIFEGRKKPGKVENKDEINKKREGKSKIFVICHKLLLRSHETLQNDINKAKKLYVKAMDFYIKLEYHEKKEIYKDLTELYNKLRKAK